MSDTSGYSIVPAEARRQEQTRAPIPPGVSVIYIDRGESDAGECGPRACGPGGVDGLRAAARALHRMADRVEAMRRSLEGRANARGR